VSPRSGNYASEETRIRYCQLAVLIS